MKTYLTQNSKQVRSKFFSEWMPGTHGFYPLIRKGMVHGWVTSFLRQTWQLQGTFTLSRAAPCYKEGSQWVGQDKIIIMLEEAISQTSARKEYNENLSETL